MRSVTGALYRPERLPLQLTTKSRQRPMRPRHNSLPQRRRRKLQEIRETTLSFLPTPTGTVVQTLAEPGQVVAAGQTVVKLAHAGPREAAVYLPETLRPALGSEAYAVLYGETASVPVRLRQLSDSADPRDPHVRSQICSRFPRRKRAAWSYRNRSGPQERLFRSRGGSHCCDHRPRQRAWCLGSQSKDLHSFVSKGQGASFE